ncbi:hypothetical protein PISMIDRAFT_418416 [Pisolithus microcarpus 441]|uniref:Uncharacterized protein n=1 Tax=Pisolithus microcarpus 441 TaxID=765257 RepID=A0A0C9YRW3_9AGAM|nr:hypothetical protein PISMIDRAFT_418416 [Pisolithus microcarpus 441]
MHGYLGSNRTRMSKFTSEVRLPPSELHDYHVHNMRRTKLRCQFGLHNCGNSMYRHHYAKVCGHARSGTDFTPRSVSGSHNMQCKLGLELFRMLAAH